jgi:hypothetical protein
MQAVKALYQNGNIRLLEPITGVDEAELFVLVLDQIPKTSSAVNTFIHLNPNSEQDFQAIGLSHFFDTEEDQHIDWEDMFDVKAGYSTSPLILDISCLRKL